MATTNKRRDLRFLLSLCNLDMQQHVSSKLAKKGYPALRPAQFALLALIDSTGVRLSDLVTNSGLAKQTVGDVIDDLEAQKLVERFADPDHGVIKRVRLATKGKAWAAEVRKISDATEAAWEAAVGKGKMKALRATLEELAAALTEQA